ncbi:MAG TPA: site-specific integrase, partial [Pyrinomonadaceae bacterium]
VLVVADLLLCTCRDFLALSLLGTTCCDIYRGNGIDTSEIGRLVAAYGYVADIAAEHGPNQPSPHDLRRTYARNAYEHDVSLLLVQAMLGHEDPKTIAYYIDVFESDDDTVVDYVRY